MENREIKAVIFDMDGVIVDSEPIHQNIEQQLFAELNLSISQEEHDSLMGTSAKDFWESIVQKHQVEISAQKLINRQEILFIEYLESDETLATISGVKEVIHALKRKQIPIAVASSSTLGIINKVLQKVSLTNTFDVILAGDMVCSSKPNPEIFLKTAIELRVEPVNCMVIEDSENGIVAANSAGMFAVAYKTKHCCNQDFSRADMIITNLNKLDLTGLLANTTFQNHERNN